MKSSKHFTAKQMKAALLAVRSKMSEPQESMLRAHYLHRRLSMERIAFFGGYDSYSAGNLQYGSLCGRIAQQLSFSPEQKTQTIATVADTYDARGHSQWQMDDVVVKALDQIGWFRDAVEEIPESERIESSETPEVEREAVIKARIGQGRFRTDVIALWGSCAVTGCSLARVLNASHIVPWAMCATDKEKIDPFNGLLLTPNLDKLVDRFLISFNDDGSIMLSKNLGEDERKSLGVGEQNKLRFVRPAMLPYLKRHRELFREGTVRVKRIERL
jgi:hypothetical protein